MSSLSSFLSAVRQIESQCFSRLCLGNADILNVLCSTIQYLIQEIENKMKSLSKGEIMRLSVYKRFPKVKGKN